jgi:predicted transcriptional regulator
MKKEKTISVHIRLPESQIKELNKIAEEQCRTQVSLIRQAVKEFLEKRNNK